jgi:hypothetical protein
MDQNCFRLDFDNFVTAAPDATDQGPMLQNSLCQYLVNVYNKLVSLSLAGLSSLVLCLQIGSLPYSQIFDKT